MARLYDSDGVFVDNSATPAHLVADVPATLTGRRSRMSYLFPHARRFALPAMAGAFGLYVVMHSPLRDVIAAMLGLTSRVCYFVCGDALTLSSPVNAIAAWVLIAAAALAAWILSDWFDGRPYERPLVFGLGALAFIAVPAAAIGGIGTWTGTALLHPPAGPLLSAIPAAFMVGVCLQRGWRPYLPRLVFERPQGLVLLVGGLATSLLLASTALSLMYPPTGYDALSYHGPLAVFLWRDGNLSAFLDRAPVVNTLANPGTIQLWYGLLQIAGAERLADLGQLPFAILGSVAVYAFTRRLGLGRGAAQLAAGAYLLAPLVVMQGGVQVADVAGAGLLMATITLASAPTATWTCRRLSMIGLGLGLVATTKLALLPCVVGVMLFVFGATLWHTRQPQRTRVAIVRLVLVGLIFFGVATPWWLRNVARYGNPVYPAGIPLIGRGIFLSSDYPRIDGEFVPNPVAWPLYPLFERHSERSGLGALFALGAVPGLLIAAQRGRRQPRLLYGFVATCLLTTWWTLTNHDPRFLLALFGLSFTFLPWSLLALPRGQRRVGAGLVAVAAIFSALVTFDQAVLPLAHLPTTRLAFYDLVWGVDPLVASLPENEGLLLHTGYANYTYPAYYPLLGRSHSRVVIPVDTEGTTESIVANMRRVGLQYAYVTTLPESRGTVEAIYDGSRFELVHTSIVETGWRSGTRRYLYRLK
jgi:hypothetical protein